MKKMWISTGLYAFCAVVWTLNFFLQWQEAGGLNARTALFGLAAVCFAISAVLNYIRIRRMKKEDK